MQHAMSISARTVTVLALVNLLWGCSPTVRIQAPEKPIEINLNVKIEQDVRVHIEKEVEDLVRNKPGVF